MRTFSHLCQYLADFFSEREMFYIKIVEKNRKTHFISKNVFSEYRTIYEIISKNAVEPERPQIIIWRRTECCSIKTT